MWRIRLPEWLRDERNLRKRRESFARNYPWALLIKEGKGNDFLLMADEKSLDPNICCNDVGIMLDPAGSKEMPGKCPAIHIALMCGQRNIALQLALFGADLSSLYDGKTALQRAGEISAAFEKELKIWADAHKRQEIAPSLPIPSEAQPVDTTDLPIAAKGCADFLRRSSSNACLDAGNHPLSGKMPGGRRKATDCRAWFSI